MNFDEILMKYKYRAAFPYIEKMNLIDVGCGTGQFIHMLNKEFPAENFYGMDQDCLSVKVARKYVHGSFYCMEFEQSNYDGDWGTLTSFNVLEHVENEDLFLSRCYASLEQDGRLILTVPNATALHKRVGDAMGISKPYKLTNADIEKGHKRVYDMSILETAVRRHGFEIIAIKGVFLKPLSSEMMMQFYSRKLFDALFMVGKELSDYCSSILVVGLKR